MKCKGKIVQIIKEEEYKKYGFPKIENVDWLNIIPEPDFKHRPFLTLALFLGGFLISFWLNDYISNVLSLIPALLLWGLGAYRLYKEGKENRRVGINGYWYFNAPLPVEKPHDFKLNDEVEIEIEIWKTKQNLK